MVKRPRLGKILICAATLTVAAVNASAALTMTAAGTNLGFTLTRFVSDVGFNSSGCCGPLGVTVLPNGNVLVDVTNQSKNYVWPDADNQNLTTAISSVAFPAFPPAYATTGGFAWGSSGSNLVKFDNSGNVLATYPQSGVSITNGLWTNPVNGHLLAQGNGIWDITITGGVPTNFRLVVSGGSDGLSVSPDGVTVYTNEVKGYNILTGALTFPLVTVPSGDGTGVISSNTGLNGDIIGNGNDGNVYLIDIHNNNNLVIIASGGTRGDYTAADTNNGTLFLTQSNEIYRLSCGAGCSVGSTGNGAPRPVPTLSELALALLAVALIGSTALMIGRRNNEAV